MQIAVCDDDKICCGQIERWINNYKKRENIDINVEIFYNGEKVLDEIKKNCWFDMIFIDVELSEITGIELGYQIRKYTGDKDISIVFISGKTIYCQQLFQLEPQNFHHKPLCEQDIVDDIEKLIKRIRKQKNLLKYYDEGVPKGILLRDILYVESRGNTIEITKKGNDKVILRESISQIEERFSEFYMCRCHRSFIANLYYVDKYCNQKFCMKNGDEIPVGRTYVNKVRQQWINYEKETL